MEQKIKEKEKINQHGSPYGLPFAIVLALLVLGGLIYMSYFHESSEQASVTDINENTIKTVPKVPELQTFLSDIVMKKLPQQEREKLISELNNRYHDNTYILKTNLIDSTVENISFHEYMSYLRVFTKEDVPLKIIDVIVESVDIRNDSAIVKITEQIAIRN